MDEKSTARDNRLSLRKNNEEVLRKKFHASANQICKSEIHALGDCARSAGFWVVWNCRAQSAASTYYYYCYHLFDLMAALELIFAP